MFQTSDGSGYEMLETGTATATTTETSARSVLWEGTYDPTSLALTSWGGRILDPSTDGNLKGYIVTPVKATSDAAGATAITTIPQTDINVSPVLVQNPVWSNSNEYEKSY